MFKNLNEASPTQNVLPSVIGGRPSAIQRAKSVTTTLFAVAGIVFAIGGGIAYLMYSQICQAQSRVADLQGQEGSSAQITKRYQTTLDNFNDTRSQLQYLEASVSQRQFVPTLVQQLETLAQKTNLQVTSIKPGPLASLAFKPAPPVQSATLGIAPAKPAAPPYDTQPVVLEISGNYRQIMTFIYDLPHFPKILCLRGVTLSPKGMAPQAANGTIPEPVLSANLSIDTYVFDPGAAVTPTAPGLTAPGSFTTARSAVDDVNNSITGQKTASDAPGSPAANAFSPATAPGSAK
jgi:Tfp pilus assembly protein PilO